MSRVTTCIATVALLIYLPCFGQVNEPFSSDAGRDEQFALDRSAVVILPVDVLSNESKYTSLADTVYRALVRQIAIIDGIHIIDPNLVVPFAGSKSSPFNIGRQLGAATVLRSSVNAVESGYRISIEHFDARTGELRSSSGMVNRSNWPSGAGEDKDTRYVGFRVSFAVNSIEQSLFPDRRPDRESMSDAARAIFLDSGLNEEIRIDALSDLRPPTNSDYPQQYGDGGAALSGDVAIVAAQIASDSRDPDIRAGIWYVMTGVPDPVLMQPLIHSLGNDSVARVRESAAIALATHNENLGVRESLDSARTNDPDLRVRQAARLAASTPDGRREILREVVMDVVRPEQERSNAFFLHSNINGADQVPMDDALMEATVTLAQTASDAYSREMIWFRLGNIAGPDVVEDLVDALAEEPSETVRDGVVRALAINIDEPGVLDALENAKLNDPSPLVRSTSERVLLGENW